MQTARSTLLAGIGAGVGAMRDPYRRSSKIMMHRTLSSPRLGSQAKCDNRRGGLVAPWTAVPALVVLATDPARDTRDLALRLLKQQVRDRAWPRTALSMDTVCKCSRSV